MRSRPGSVGVGQRNKVVHCGGKLLRRIFRMAAAHQGRILLVQRLLYSQRTISVENQQAIVLRQKAKRLLQQRHDPLAYPTALRRTGDACCPVAGCIADTRVQPVDAHQGFAVIPGTGTGGQTFAAHARYRSVKIDASHFHHLPCRISFMCFSLLYFSTVNMGCKIQFM